MEINEADSEIIIKPGELYRLTESEKERALPIKGFLQPGEIINLGANTKVCIQKLTYLEPISYNGVPYILLLVRYLVFRQAVMLYLHLQLHEPWKSFV